MGPDQPLDHQGSEVKDSAPRIVLTGQGTWCAILADGLRQYGGLEVRQAPFDSIKDAWDLRRWWTLARADLVVRVGFRPGARTWRGRGIDTAFRAIRALSRTQRTAYYWLGTDVLGMLGDWEAGVTPAWLDGEIASAAHASAGSEHLVEELRVMRIAAKNLPHSYTNIPQDDVVPPLPARFSVLTYIPDSRAGFYGAPAILDAARHLPEVPFKILGGVGPAAGQAPENVEYLGWKDDASRWFREASCIVRLAQHDGSGGTMLEGLAYGRPVIYSFAQEDVIYVPFGDPDRLLDALRRLLAQHEAGDLHADEVVARKIRQRHSPQSCYPAIARWLTEAAGCCDEAGSAA